MEKENYKGHTIKIEQDENPESPREWDNLGKIICFHKEYELGDPHDYNSENYKGWDEFLAEIKTTKADIILPLYLYDHSGLRIKVGSFAGLLPQGHAEFDSGQVGFIIATAEAIRKSFGVKKITTTVREKAEKVLRGEVETYDKYISGQVCGFVIENSDGENLDSCWGFYGYEDAVAEAKSAIDYLVKDAKDKKTKKVKSYIKASVPLIYRRT